MGIFFFTAGSSIVRRIRKLNCDDLREQARLAIAASSLAEHLGDDENKDCPAKSSS
jgi:U3 small nucleolar ribonucleoprotein component